MELQPPRYVKITVTLAMIQLFQLLHSSRHPIYLTRSDTLKLEMNNNEPLTIDRKLEILHSAIDKILAQLEKQDNTKVKPSVADLIRLLELETELAAKLAPQKTVIQWIDPYLPETNTEPGDNPPKAA